MTPVTHRGRRRLEPEQPVERLRGLLDDDLRASGHDLPDDERADDDHRSGRGIAAPEEQPWVSPVRARVPWATLLVAAAVVIAVVLSLVLRGGGDDEVVASSSSGEDIGPSSPPEPSAGPAEGASAGVSAGPSPGVPGQEADVAAGPVTVHVVGEVERPGVVELPGEARIADAVEAAGGLSEQAVVDAVNLAAPVVDGAQVVIPDQQLAQQWEQSPPSGASGAAAAGAGAASGAGADAGTGTGAGEGAAAGATTAAGGSGGQAPPGADGSAAGGSTGATIDLNSATAAQLEELPKVGPVLAQRIIDHREQIGGFRSVEELDDVSGIGPAMMEAVSPLVTV